jgi:inosine-uridine nucleoside N-ribohydrolase
VSEVIPVVLDVDTGIDDALAIMLAVRHPALEVKAITCVAGNVSVDKVVRNTLGILQLLNRSDIPVARGMGRPILGETRDASHVHGAEGIGEVILPRSGSSPASGHAVELMKDAITGASRAVTIIALAPLTNVATLLLMYPEVATRIDRIVFMGGAIGQGNASASAEFNFWQDPEAADIVLRSGVNLTMYGLEPFYEVALDAADIDELLDAVDPVARSGRRAALLSREDRVLRIPGQSPGGAPRSAMPVPCAPPSSPRARASVARPWLWRFTTRSLEGELLSISGRLPAGQVGRRWIRTRMSTW